ISGVGRYPDNSSSALRNRLAANLGVPVDWVTVGAGSAGILQQLALAYVDPGDEVVHGAPSFEAYPIFAAMVGGVAKPVALSDFALHGPSLAAAVGPRTRLVLVAQPNNPTGPSMPGPELENLARAIPAQTCLLVVDEAYHEFGRSGCAAIDLVRAHPHVVVLRTFSKAHGLASLRVGYAIAQPDVVDALDRVLPPFSVSSLGQLGAMASLDAPDEMSERVGAVVAERERVRAELAGGGWPVPVSEANFVWLPVGDSTDALASTMQAGGVMTRALSPYGVRVTIGLVAENDQFLGGFFEAVAGPVGSSVAANWGLPRPEISHV
ncbi:MAG: aminotransferase class I/II-fold pyridoxal phosphate-dependent enzyme, partial [Acidimicrobiales bacterium]